MEEKHEVLQVLRSPSRHVKKKNKNYQDAQHKKTAIKRSTCNSAMNTYKWSTHSTEDLGTPMVYD